MANLVRKINIVSLSGNLESRLIPIREIKWQCSFSSGNIFFWQIWSKKSKFVSLIWNLESRLIRICRIQCWCSLFSVFDREYYFGANLVQKIKIDSLSWNLVPTLIWICRIQCWCSLFSFYIRNRNTFFRQTLSKKSKLIVWAEIWYLLLVTKIVRLTPTSPLFNVGCKFASSYLATNVWHSFFRLGTTLNQGEGKFWVSLSKLNMFLGLFHECIVSLNNFCDWF